MKWIACSWTTRSRCLIILDGHLKTLTVVLNVFPDFPKLSIFCISEPRKRWQPTSYLGNRVANCSEQNICFLQMFRRFWKYHQNSSTCCYTTSWVFQTSQVNYLLEKLMVSSVTRMYTNVWESQTETSGELGNRRAEKEAIGEGNMECGAGGADEHIYWGFLAVEESFVCTIQKLIWWTTNWKGKKGRWGTFWYDSFLLAEDWILLELSFAVYPLLFLPVCFPTELTVWTNTNTEH